jgi:amino-acid N-acetyltransferase
MRAVSGMNDAIRQIPYDTSVSALLVASGLPIEDLASNTEVTFFGAEADRLLGVVALEGSGHSVLLRSLAVSPSARGAGVGDALLRYAERAAAGRGVAALYLLTSTAKDYFASRGYVVLPRESAPTAIAATRQFAGLCPGSSAFMVKRNVG